MLQPKDKDWLNGYKNKTPIYVVYKRPTSKQGTHRLKVKVWKKIFHKIETKRKQGNLNRRAKTIKALEENRGKSSRPEFGRIIRHDTKSMREKKMR